MNPYRRRTWIWALTAIVFGAAFVQLSLGFRDRFAQRWEEIELGMSVDEVTALIGEPDLLVPEFGGWYEDSFHRWFRIEHWYYDRPMGLGHYYRRFSLKFEDEIVVAKSPNKDDDK